MGRQTILKRLIYSQNHPVWNSPIKDGPSEFLYEEKEKEQLSRLIKTKKYNPKTAQIYNLDIEKKNYQVGPYRVEAVRCNTQNEDMGGSSFELHSRLVRNDRWEISVFDQTGTKISHQAVMIPKAGDSDSLLYSKILNILPVGAIIK